MRNCVSIVWVRIDFAQCVGKEFIYLTVTIPNVKGDSLEEIKKYNKDFEKLMKRK